MFESKSEEWIEKGENKQSPKISDEKFSKGDSNKLPDKEEVEIEVVEDKEEIELGIIENKDEKVVDHKNKVKFSISIPVQQQDWWKKQDHAWQEMAKKIKKPNELSNNIKKELIAQLTVNKYSPFARRLGSCVGITGMGCVLLVLLTMWLIGIAGAFVGAGFLVFGSKEDDVNLSFEIKLFAMLCGAFLLSGVEAVFILIPISILLGYGGFMCFVPCIRDLTSMVVCNNIKKIRDALIKGLDINSPAVKKLFDLAVKEGNLEVIMLLLYRKIKIEKPKELLSKLIATNSAKANKIIKLLLQAGIKPSSMHLDEIVKQNNFEMATALLKAAGPTDYALKTAVRNYNFEITKTLLDVGAKPTNNSLEIKEYLKDDNDEVQIENNEKLVEPSSPAKNDDQMNNQYRFFKQKSVEPSAPSIKEAITFTNN